MPALSRFLDHKLVRAFALLTGGSVLGQLALVASAPILTRLFTPSDFGVLAVFVSLSAIMTVVATCRLEFAIPVASESEAVQLVVAGLLVATGIAALLALAAIFVAPLLDARLPDYDCQRLAWLLAAMPFLHMTPALGMHWYLRFGDFTTISRARILVGCTQALAQIAAGLLGAGVLGLVLGYMAGYVCQSLYLLAASTAERRRPLLQHWRGFSMRILRSHRAYILLNASSSVLQMAAQMAPPVIIAAIYGPAVAGLFAIGQRVVGVPVRMLGQSAAQVFMSQFRDAAPGELQRMFFQLSLAFLALAVIGSLPLPDSAAPALFAYFFGETWRAAGEIVQWLVPSFIARFVATPVAQALNVRNAQRWHLISAALGIAAHCSISFALAAALNWPYQLPIILYALGTAASFALLWHRARLAVTSPLATGG